MSGDMCTSLGNGFTNLMIWLFWAREKGLRDDQVDGVVEGDDGLFRIDGPAPTVLDFERMGFRAKIEHSCDIGKAGFCTMYFDTEVFENVTNPAELLADFGWTHSQSMQGKPRIMLELLRAKADSLEAELPGAPIVGSLVNYVRRCVGEGRRRFEGPGGEKSYWERRLNDTPRGLRPVAPATRALVEQLFGVTEFEQRTIESYLDHLNTLHELDHPCILAIMRPEWFCYYDRYCGSFRENIPWAY